jgi:hypothetical protein
VAPAQAAAAATPRVAEMIARAVDDAGSRLRDLRREEWEESAVAAAALALAVAASAIHPDFALPLFLGGVFVGFRAVLASWRRWDLVDRLVSEPDAYAIPEVRTHAEQKASMSNRRSLSRAIRWRLEHGENPRVLAASSELAALADELADPHLEVEPACAVACSRLLTDGATSPLINSALPAEDVRSHVLQIRAGFHPRS